METLEELKAQRANLNKRIAHIERIANDETYEWIAQLVLSMPRNVAILTQEAEASFGPLFTPKRTIMMVRNVCEANGLVFKRWKSAKGVRGFIIYEKPCQ